MRSLTTPSPASMNCPEFHHKRWGFAACPASMMAVDVQVGTVGVSSWEQCPCYFWKTAFPSTASHVLFSVAPWASEGMRIGVPCTAEQPTVTYSQHADQLKVSRFIAIASCEQASLTKPESSATECNILYNRVRGFAFSHTPVLSDSLSL